VILWTVRLVLAAVLAGALVARPSLAWAQRQPASIVIVTGQQATTPVPTLIEGSQNTLANQDVADQLFLRLAVLGPGMVTAGDRGFVPQLARSWTRRDSVTLAFDLDPRARWHDGTPVTARDVVFTMRRARDATVAPRLANVTRRIAAVEAEGERTVVFRYDHVYAEQLYDAAFHTAIIPAHLLERLPPTDSAWAPFVARPVGSGPYRWVRRQEGEFIELAGNEEFFLGAPAIKRVIVQVAVSPDARLNLLLAGGADATDNIPPPLSNVARVEQAPHLKVFSVPSSNLGYLLFNHRNPANLEEPHPILGDRDVRRALILALDRRLLAHAVLGRYGGVPYGPVSAQLWIGHGTPSAARQDQSTARRLLAGRGWVDRDRDGVRENRSGEPLVLRLMLPTSSQLRVQMALMIQEQLRQVGVQLELLRLEPAVWGERRAASNFDIDFSAATQDPSPHEFLRRVEEAAPAVFLYNQTYVLAVNRRFPEVIIRPVSAWLSLWRWPAPRS
jgi:peptide/nickel transport system substrate-binding protein